jgi:hypothetical protein
MCLRAVVLCSKEASGMRTADYGLREHRHTADIIVFASYWLLAGWGGHSVLRPRQAPANSQLSQLPPAGAGAFATACGHIDTSACSTLAHKGRQRKKKKKTTYLPIYT